MREERKLASSLILSLEGILNDIHLYEAGVRGYMLTKDEDLKENTYELIDDLKKKKEGIQEALLQDSITANYINSFDALVAKRLGLLNSIEDSLNYSSIRSKSLILEGDDIMDELRTRLSALENILEEKLEKKEVLYQNYESFILIFIPIFFIMALLFNILEFINSKKLHEKVQKTGASNLLQKQYYHFLFTSDPNPILIFTPDFKLSDCNPATEAFFKTIKEDLINQRLKDFSLMVKGTNTNVAELNMKEKVEDLEVVIEFEEDQKILLFDLVPKQLEEEEIQGYYVSLIDVTKRTELEKELNLTEKIGYTHSMARSLAHEVRNPLTNIQLANSELQEIVAEKDHDLVNIIDRNSDRIAQLISNLLSSSATIEQKFEPINLNEIAENIQKDLKDRLALEEVKLVLELSQENPVTKATEILETNILNIVVNAIEAKDKQGAKIHLRTKVNELKKLAIIEVEDNGIGMSEDTKNRIFDPMFTKKADGNGLGLTTVQTSIRNFGGMIKVKSTLGKGTLFRVELPLYVKET
ncbi:MAG: ATP-binding protein [Flavobacteriales bacterium]|nr:ATP-binding protein [Flavobacteriales bacterium]